MNRALIISGAVVLLLGCDGGVLSRDEAPDGGVKADSKIKADARAKQPDGKAKKPDAARLPDRSALPDKRPPGPDKNLHKGKLLPQKLKITYYYLAQEKDYAAGPPNSTLTDSSCKAIATVSQKFYYALCIEGSGKLKDGRVVNYWTKCTCAPQCSKGARICYKVLDPKKYPWGMGASANGLVPMRSWAVDKAVIPLGTILYVPDWDGVLLPKVDGLGGFTHDGCFRADDVGGGINGYHYDFFAGTRAMYLALSKIAGGKFKTFTTFSVYKDPGRCAYLKGKP